MWNDIKDGNPTFGDYIEYETIDGKFGKTMVPDEHYHKIYPEIKRWRKIA